MSLTVRVCAFEVGVVGGRWEAIIAV